MVIKCWTMSPHRLDFQFQGSCCCVKSCLVVNLLLRLVPPSRDKKKKHRKTSYQGRYNITRVQVEPDLSILVASKKKLCFPLNNFGFQRRHIYFDDAMWIRLFGSRLREEEKHCQYFDQEHPRSIHWNNFVLGLRLWVCVWTAKQWFDRS